MSGSLEKPLTLIGRILLCMIFVMSGIGMVFDFANTTGYMEKEGMPAAPLVLVGAISLEIVGGLMVLTGFKARIGALLLLIVFLVPATFIFHHFWTLEGQEQQMQMINFMKNLSILGALLLIVARGAGPLSVDGSSRHAT